MDTKQRHYESDSKKSEEISLRDDAEHSNTTEIHTAEQEGAEGVEDMPEVEAEEEVFPQICDIAEDDIAEALRVQNLLQSDFAIKPGIILLRCNVANSIYRIQMML